MTVKVLKPKKPIRNAIDILGSVKDDIKRLKAVEKDTEEDLRKYIEAKNLGQDEGALAQGDHYELDISKVGTTRNINDMKKLHAELGDQTFYNLCSFPLKYVDDYLTKIQKKKLITEGRGGSRKLKFKEIQVSTLKKTKTRHEHKAD